MADESERISIDVELNADAIRTQMEDLSVRIMALKDRQKNLNAEIKKAWDKKDIEAVKKYQSELVQVTDELAWATKNSKNMSAELKVLAADSRDYADTLQGQREKLADMQKAFANFTKAQRESAEGQAFLESIQEQDKAVKQLEADMGLAQRNVGNYPKQITAIVPGLNQITGKLDGVTSAIQNLGTVTPNALKGMANGFKAATVQALKFIATPIGAIIAAIVVAVKACAAIFNKLKDAFAKNDEAGTKLAKLMASFKPITELISAAFSKLADVIGWVAEKMADLIAFFSDSAKEAQNLVVATDNLEEAERQYVVNSAKRSRDIAKLRAEAKDSSDVSERMAKLSEAIDLEKQNLEEEKQIKEERLRILEETARRESDTSDETMNKIAQARADLYKAEENYFNGVKALQKEYSAAEAENTKAVEDEAKKRKEARAKAHEEAKKKWVAEQEAEERYQELLRTTEEELDKLAKKHEEEKQKAAQWWAEYNQMLADQEADFVDKQEQTLRKWGLIKENEYLNELQALSADYANKLLNEEEFQQAKANIRAKYDKKAQEAIEAETDRQKKAFNSIAKSGANTFNSLAQLVEAFGDDSAEASRAQKGFALAAIIANEAEAIASGVAATSEAIKGATKAGAATGIAAPLTTPAFIAEMVGIVSTQLATAIGGIVSAKSILAGGKFEKGGIVGGTSYTGDHVGIMANSREMVLTQSQQARLFQLANAPMSSTYEASISAMRVAMASMPAPVLTYQEFKDFEQKTTTIQEIAKV